MHFRGRGPPQKSRLTAPHGSTESKKVDQEGAESDEEQRIGPHFGQSVTDWSVSIAEPIEADARELARLHHDRGPLDGNAAELAVRVLAVGNMVIFSVYLGRRGSSQSKRVGAPHHATAEEG